MKLWFRFHIILKYVRLNDHLAKETPNNWILNYYCSKCFGSILNVIFMLFFFFFFRWNEWNWFCKWSRNSLVIMAFPWFHSFYISENVKTVNMHIKTETPFIISSNWNYYADSDSFNMFVFLSFYVLHSVAFIGVNICGIFMTSNHREGFHTQEPFDCH